MPHKWRQTDDEMREIWINMWGHTVESANECIAKFHETDEAGKCCPEECVHLLHRIRQPDGCPLLECHIGSGGGTPYYSPLIPYRGDHCMDTDKEAAIRQLNQDIKFVIRCLKTRDTMMQQWLDAAKEWELDECFKYLLISRTSLRKAIEALEDGLEEGGDYRVEVDDDPEALARNEMHGTLHFRSVHPIQQPAAKDGEA